MDMDMDLCPRRHTNCAGHNERDLLLSISTQYLHQPLVANFLCAITRSDAPIVSRVLVCSCLYQQLHEGHVARHCSGMKYRSPVFVGQVWIRFLLQRRGRRGAQACCAT
jgi:hypothetical protein